MADRDDLDNWVIEALTELGGKGSIIEIAKRIWDNHEEDLRDSGNLFYTWQYDYRWSGTRLRDKGIIQPADSSPKGVWILRKQFS